MDGMGRWEGASEPAHSPSCEGRYNSWRKHARGKQPRQGGRAVVVGTRCQGDLGATFSVLQFGVRYQVSPMSTWVGPRGRCGVRERTKDSRGGRTRRNGRSQQAPKDRPHPASRLENPTACGSIWNVRSRRCPPFPTTSVLGLARPGCYVHLGTHNDASSHGQLIVATTSEKSPIADSIGHEVTFAGR